IIPTLSCVVYSRRLPLNHPTATVYTMNAAQPTRIAGDIRISRLRDDSLPPETQKRRITDWATAHGHQVVAWYEDPSVSGKDLDRPGLERLRANWKLYDAAVAAKIDRWARSTIGFSTLVSEAHS